MDEETDIDQLMHRETTQKIIKVFYSVYNELGYGFLESVYEEAMLIALREAGLAACNQENIDVWFHGYKVGAFIADIIVENAVMLELKAVKELNEQHTAQLLNYLRATNIEVGLLFNFGPTPQFKRKVFVNARKPSLKSIEAEPKSYPR